MSDIEKPASIGRSLLGSSRRFREMLKVRRGIQQVDPADVRVEGGGSLNSLFSFMPKRKSPTGKSLIISPKGVKRSHPSRSHELTHAYQSELPIHSKTIGELIAGLGMRVNKQAPAEIGAGLRELKGLGISKPDALRNVIYKSPQWYKIYGKDKSFLPLLGAKRIGAGKRLGEINRTKSANVTTIIADLNSSVSPAIVPGMRDRYTMELDKTASAMFLKAAAEWEKPDMQKFIKDSGKQRTEFKEVKKSAALGGPGAAWERFRKGANVTADLRKARTATDTYPTEKMTEAGNYKKGRIKFRGIHIAIENPKGSIRSGTSDAGKSWSQTMGSDYGYFTGSPGKAQPVAVDGDAIDVFIGPDLESDFVVVIDQYFNGKYDESKFVVGVTSQEQGEKVYLDCYEKGWKLGPVSTTTIPQLKVWLKSGEHTKPFKGQLVKAARTIRSMLGL